VIRQVDGWLDLPEPVSIVVTGDGRLIERTWYGRDGWSCVERVVKGPAIGMPRCSNCGHRTWAVRPGLNGQAVCITHDSRLAPVARARWEQRRDHVPDHHAKHRWMRGYTDPED
jgi:hypothetical protein